MNASNVSLATTLEEKSSNAAFPAPWEAQVTLTLPNRHYLQDLLRELHRATTSLDPRVRPERSYLDDAIRAMDRASFVVQLIDKAASAHFHAEAARELQSRLTEEE